jgi:hypothetical protein
MGRTDRPLAGNGREEDGCAYLFSDAGEGVPDYCGAPRRPGSSYCPRHHALCYLPRGSRAEKARLREAKALADMVGGRCGWEEEDEPPQRFIERLERAVRGFS